MGRSETDRVDAVERLPRDKIHRPRQQDVTARELVLSTRMPRIAGAVDEPGFLAAVVREVLLDVEDAERLLPWRGEGDILTDAAGPGGGLPYRERDRPRPWKPAEQRHL